MHMRFTHLLWWDPTVFQNDKFPHRRQTLLSIYRSIEMNFYSNRTTQAFTTFILVDCHSVQFTWFAVNVKRNDRRLERRLVY